MTNKIIKHKYHILFLISPSIVFLFCGIINQFSITIIPSLLLSSSCFFSEPSLINNSFLHRDIQRLIFLETSYVICSKTLTRIPMNFFTFFLLTKLQSDFIILLGLLFYSCVIIIYIYSKSCLLFIFGRIIEGIAESLVITASYSFLSTVFKTKYSKSISIGLTNFFYFIGLSLAPFIGGFLYLNYRHILTYVSIIPLHLITLSILLINSIYWNKYNKFNFNNSDISLIFFKTQRNKQINIFLKILINPYILINFIGIALCSGTIGALSTSLPNWMRNNYDNNKPEQGMVWMLGGVFYGLAQIVSTYFQKNCNRFCYLVPMFGLVLISVSLFTISFHLNWIFLTLNMTLMIFGIGLVEFFLYPCMITIAGSVLKKQSNSISAVLITTANSIGFLIGSFLTGFMSDLIGFKLNSVIFGSLIGIYIPLCFLLKNFMKDDQIITAFNDNQRNKNNEILELYEIKNIFQKNLFLSRFTRL